MEKDEKIRRKDDAIKKYIKERKRKLEEMTNGNPAPDEWKKSLTS